MTKCKFCLFGRAVSTYISVSEVITVLIKYYVCKCPSCTRHQYISNHNIEAVKFASYPCLWASWESSSKKTFIGLVLENETEKQQYTFFLAATKQLYDWFSPSVCLSVRLSVRPSVCHTFFTMFPSSYHHEIFRSYYHGQKWCPCKRSRSDVKGQGHRGQHPT